MKRFLALTILAGISLALAGGGSVRADGSTQPTLHVHQFDDSTAVFGIEIPGLGVIEAVLAGTTTVHVWVGPDGLAADTDGDGLDQVVTQMVAMNLAGSIDTTLGSSNVVVRLREDVPSVGQIEEAENVQDGRLDVPPYHPSGAADSFFDVFFAVDVPFFGTLHGGTPVRISTIVHGDSPAGGQYETVLGPGEEIPLLKADGADTGLRLASAKWVPGSSPDNLPPSVSVDAIQPVEEGDTVTVAGTFTDADAVGEHSATIDWGDGSFEDGSVTEGTELGTVAGVHSYTDDGTFAITICVADIAGATGCDTVQVSVLNAAPLVEAGPDGTASEGDEIPLGPATFTDKGLLDTHSATIDWGDGTLQDGVILQGTGSGTADGSHIYAAPGSYTVTVTVIDDDLGVGSDTLTVTVLGLDDPDPPAPEAACDGTDDNGDGQVDEGFPDFDADGVADCVDPDDDNDGIDDLVDAQFEDGSVIDRSTEPSDSFTDQHIGGTSFGSIDSRDGMLITVADAAGPAGIRLGATGGDGTALVSSCGFTLRLTDGDELLVTCGSLTMDVVAGPVEVELGGGNLATVPSGASATVTGITESQFRITNSPGGTGTVTVLLGDEHLEVRPGESIEIDTAPNELFLASPQGFGDRQNSVAWSMQWWDKAGKLYVGTNHAWMCWAYASTITKFPVLGYLYPPDDPDVQCTQDFRNLPLGAEIWAWDAATDVWERVYQSPLEVPFPDFDKPAPRELGFRTMALFTEPDGTEALYVAGTNPRSLYSEEDQDQVPPPRILRSTDGITFEPIPQDPGTIMGELPKSSFRALTPYRDRLYVIHGGIHGDGTIYESADPAAGNDAWRQVSPDGLRVFELQTFNGILYAGAVDRVHGYAVFKMDATGDPPYNFIPIVTRGGYLTPWPSKAVVSMHVFQDGLYVGTANPSEIVRINADDSWDLIVGTPRETPDGWKYPLSGMDEGFNYSLNDHIWRMETYGGDLYVGTYDASTSQRLCTDRNQALGPFMGFDLYRTSDGLHFSALTIDGFGDVFDYGIRTFQSTPHGLFIGTADAYFGNKVYRGTGPLPRFDGLAPPGLVAAAADPDGIVLTWSAPPGSTVFRIYRSTFVTLSLGLTDSLSLSSLPGGACHSGPADDHLLPDLTDVMIELLRNEDFVSSLLDSALFSTDGPGSDPLAEILSQDPALLSEFVEQILIGNPDLLSQMLNDDEVISALLERDLASDVLLQEPGLLSEVLRDVLIHDPAYMSDLLKRPQVLSGLIESELLVTAASRDPELVVEFLIQRLAGNQALLDSLLQDEQIVEALRQAGLLPETVVELLQDGLLANPRLSATVPDVHQEIGTTTGTSFVDATAEPGVKYSYYVIAEDASGNVSGKSNLVTFPLLVNGSLVVDAGPDLTVDEGTEVVVQAAFSDGLSGSHLATIDWGDGTVDEGAVDEPAGAVSGSHLYAAAGSYTVELCVTDDGGATSCDTLTVSVVVVDDTPRSVTVIQPGGPIDIAEDGATAGYALVLDSPPSGTVTITLLPDGQVNVDKRVLTFAPDNWNVPQTVTVSAVDDAVVEGTHTGTVSHSASGGGYDGVSIPNIVAAIADNDVITEVEVTGVSTTDRGVVIGLSVLNELAIDEVVGTLNIDEGDLTLETTNGIGTAALDLGDGLSIEGSATLEVVEGGIDVVLGEPTLRFVPPPPDGSALTGGSGVVAFVAVDFEVDLKDLPAGASLSADFSKDATAFVDSPGATFQLAAAAVGGTIDDLTEDLAFAVHVNKSGFTNDDLGTNTARMSVSMEWFDQMRAEGKEIVITKIDDDGNVYTSLATCSKTADRVTCTAEFAGQAGGFSVFALLAVAPAVVVVPTLPDLTVTVEAVEPAPIPKVRRTPTPITFPETKVVPEDRIAAVDPAGGILRVVQPTTSTTIALSQHGVTIEIPKPSRQQTFQVRIRPLEPDSLEVRPEGRVLSAVQVELFDVDGNPIDDVRTWLPIRFKVELSDEAIAQIGGLDAAILEHVMGRIQLQLFDPSPTGGTWTSASTDFDWKNRVLSASASRFATFALVWSAEEPAAAISPSAMVTFTAQRVRGVLSPVDAMIFISLHCSWPWEATSAC